MPGKFESCAASSAPAGPLPMTSTSTAAGSGCLDDLGIAGLVAIQIELHPVTPSYVALMISTLMISVGIQFTNVNGN